MTDNEIKTISAKIESLHAKILKSKFAEQVAESEMMSLILAVKELNRQKEEIEKLNALIAETNKCRGSVIQAVTNIDKARTEAVKEFAERLKKRMGFCDLPNGIVRSHIDNLLKETVGDNNG